MWGSVTLWVHRGAPEPAAPPQLGGPALREGMLGSLRRHWKGTLLLLWGLPSRGPPTPRSGPSLASSLPTVPGCRGRPGELGGAGGQPGRGATLLRPPAHSGRHHGGQARGRTQGFVSWSENLCSLERPWTENSKGQGGSLTLHLAWEQRRRARVTWSPPAAHRWRRLVTRQPGGGSKPSCTHDRHHLRAGRAGACDCGRDRDSATWEMGTEAHTGSVSGYLVSHCVLLLFRLHQGLC